MEQTRRTFGIAVVCVTVQIASIPAWRVTARGHGFWRSEGCSRGGIGSELQCYFDALERHTVEAEKQRPDSSGHGASDVAWRCCVGAYKKLLRALPLQPRNPERVG